MSEHTGSNVLEWSFGDRVGLGSRLNKGNKYALSMNAICRKGADWEKKKRNSWELSTGYGHSLTEWEDKVEPGKQEKGRQRSRESTLETERGESLHGEKAGRIKYMQGG